MSEPEIPKINVPFSFTRRPTPIPPDLRTDWRVAVLLLILYYSRGYRVSLKKLHVINWAIRSSENRELLLEYLLNKVQPHDIIIRFEPGIIRAVDFAKGYELIKMEYSKPTGIMLTDKGIQMARKIDGFNDCFVKEKEFLRKIKPYVLEKNISSLLNWEFSQ
jgi:hypothetical protein